MNFIDFSRCIGCPLESKKALTPLYSMVCNPESPKDVLFLSMYPTKEDEESGRIFGSDAGLILREFADKCDFSFAMSYVVQCRPTDIDNKNRPPSAKEINYCSKYLNPLVGKANPKVVVLVGEPAIKYFLEGAISSHIIKGKVSVGKLRGKVLDMAGSKRVCIYQPAYYMRPDGPGKEVLRSHYMEDFTTVEALVNGTYKPAKAKTELLTDYKDVLELTKMIRNHKGLVSIDFEVNTNEKFEETASLYKDKTKALTVGLAINGETGYCIPLDHKESPFIGKQMPLVSMLENKVLLSHNVMFELLCLDRFYDMDSRKIKFEDSLILAYILNPDDRKGRDLKTLTDLYTPFGNYERDKDLYFDKLPPSDKNFGNIPMSILAPYNAYDALCTYLVYETLMAKVIKEKREKLYHWMKAKIPMLATMTHNGILFNYPAHRQIKANLDRSIETIHKNIMQHPHIQEACKLSNTEDFNTKSSLQKQKLLFDVLRLAPIKKTPKKEPSADGATLENYSNIPVVAAVLAEIKCRDALSKYIGPLDMFICEDGSGHPLFNIAKTVTGRLSSSAFSIQIIPRSPDMRDMFRSEDDFTLVSVDLNQAELRCLATIADEKVMIKAFHEGADIHQSTGDDIGISRQAAKIVNFGIIYGMSSRGLANALSIHEKEAQLIIDKYMETYPGVAQYTRIIQDMVLNSKPIHTPFGRVRVFQFDSRSEKSYQEVCRQAVNYPIQSIASDIMLTIGEKLCNLYGYRLNRMIGYKDPSLHNNLQELKIIPHALIHDEIIVSVHNTHVDTYKALGVEIAQTIELPFKMKVPLTADAASGSTWGNISRAHK